MTEPDSKRSIILLTIITFFMTNASAIEPECGLRKMNKIIEGKDAKISDFPWMAALFYDKKLDCAGSVINSKFILTAGHCTEGRKTALLKARLAAHDISGNGDHQDFDVKNIISHPNYSSDPLQNDVALLELKKEIRFGENIQPICLPTSGQSYTGQVGSVAGWGKKKDNGKPSNVLLTARMVIENSSQCFDHFSEILLVLFDTVSYPDTFMCAIGETKKAGICTLELRLDQRFAYNTIFVLLLSRGTSPDFGDSGAPLMVADSNNQWYVVGIVSWSVTCDNEENPASFTRVTSYLPFIKEKTG